MSRFVSFIVATLAIVAALATMDGSEAHARHAYHVDTVSQQHRAVSYAQRNADAPFRAYLRPGAAVTIERQCPNGGYFTEMQAYRSDGSALGAQRTIRYGDGSVALTLWRDHSGRAVTFDGVTFRNGRRAASWVAGWCS